MAGFRKILSELDASLGDRRGVSSAEYAILAVGIAVMVGTAIIQFSLVSPMEFAGSALLDGQSSVIANAR